MPVIADRRPVSTPPTASNTRRVASSAASLITTSLPASPTILAMGTYQAFRERFATIHPRYPTPSYALIAAGIGSALFYSILTFLSESVLTDTIYLLGIMICLYYGLTALACIWYFRHELLADVQSFVLKLLFQRLTRLRQRREHLRCRSGDPGSWDDPARRGGHAGHARVSRRSSAGRPCTRTRRCSSSTNPSPKLLPVS